MTRGVPADEAALKLQEGGKVITVEPGLIGGEVNRLLAAYQKKHKLPDRYKIGPDPSSIDSCMIGGIVSNNSSGMCCGVKQVRTSQQSYGTGALPCVWCRDDVGTGVRRCAPSTAAS